MQRGRVITYLAGLAVLFAVGFWVPGKLSAHCDGMDGPVVKAAQRALETGNVNAVLIWVIILFTQRGFLRQVGEA